MNKLSIVAILASTLLFSCGGEDAKSKPIKETPKQEAGSPDVNTKPGKFDPAKNAAQEPAGPLTSISFNEYTHDFGTIDEGDVVVHTFEFVNSGTEPLILDKCKGSCGCTVPQWPRQPIPVGGSGEIKVQFDSSNKPGMQNKVVTITANTESKVKKLLIRAQVGPRS